MSLLDEYVPIIREAEIPENPFAPITPFGRRLPRNRGMIWRSAGSIVKTATRRNWRLLMWRSRI